jgi:hypothetical protein
MPSINDLYPSNYLKAADLNGEEWNVTIERIEMSEPMGDKKEVKPVLYFRGADKGMVLNKTNATKIATAYGDDTDDWVGKPIVLFPDKVNFQGEMRDALRVRIPPRGSRTVGAPGGGNTYSKARGDDFPGDRRPAPRNKDGDIDDEIAF